MLSGFAIKSIRGSGWQGLLEEALREVFPAENILSNAKKDVSIKNPATGTFLEIDLWIPNLNLCFEFQDAYHYTTTWYHHDSLNEVQYKDCIKRDLVQQQGATLIGVPYWWASDSASLVATIQFQRPDLQAITNGTIDSLTDEDMPIELNPPFGGLEDVNIPDVGELMYASFPPVNSFVQTISPANTWWIGEKYDGIRCCWNPSKRNLFTKTAIRVFLLPKIQRQFPSSFLDAEIWYGRGLYGESQKLLRASIETINWSLFRLIVFDVPSSATFHLPFEKRYYRLLSGVPRDHLFLIPAIRMLCDDSLTLSAFLACVLEDGGEGAVLRRPASVYEHGRSSDLLKLKTSRGDREALVFDVDHQARTLKLQLPEGAYFDMTADDVLYDVDPKKGDVVTFSFETYSRSTVPVRPKIFRIRTDVNWEDVVRSYIKDSPKEERAANYTSKPAGYWTSEKGKKMREFFEIYAKNNGFDPLIPQNWYYVSRSEVESIKGAPTILGYFDNSLTKALVSLFPEIDLDELKFPVLPANYLLDVRKRREVFDEHAQNSRFDPLVASNWYATSKRMLSNNNKAVTSVVNYYYNGSVVSALLHLYPDIGLDRKKLLEASHFDLPENRKQLFLELAKDKQFDPLVHSNWYSMSLSSFLCKRGAREVLSYHSGSYVTALIHLFPNLGLDVAKFTKENFYENEENQREFFVNLAKEMEFDPCVPENWYPLPLELILPHKGAVVVLSRYKHSLATALPHLFPNIPFQKSKFLPVNYWISMDNRRNFLINFAKEKGFDPLSPSQWSSYASSSIKGGEALLTYYGGSLYRALLSLFPTIPLDPLEFRIRPSQYWTNWKNQREFFKKLAAASGFDPLVPNNWYEYNIKKIVKYKGAKSLLVHFNGSFVSALLSSFPDVPFDTSKFNTRRNYWRDENNRRKFFFDFAKQKNFDPLLPHNWYSVSTDDLSSLKTCALVREYGGSVVRSLINVFPDIGLNQSKFRKPKL